MALDLDYRTAEIVSEHLGGRPNLGNITLRQAIGIYTAEKIAETVNYAKANSKFYAEKLADYEGNGVEGWTDIPFTTMDELRERGMDFLCVRPSEISRIVTMDTSGTTGNPKRIYFTEEDQELTRDFFHHGMKLIVDETDVVLILMPSESDGSIGKLLAEGLARSGVRAIGYGIPGKKESEKILQLIRDEGVTSIVAAPTHMVALAREAQKQAERGAEEIYLRSVLLSAEFVPNKTVMMLEEVFQCMVFEHYGMTEMGLGCAVSCGYGKGYHIREADIFIELINPITGEVVKGESPKTPGYSNFGEIVFTTLTRKGMPFIRYRTGDFSRWILDECPCGSQLKRLDKVYPADDREQPAGR
ncbi:MAG: phenylacetate--CoA ligase family protein [Firmicutes bacterium]|nr:phenylacetate--CoA ligase family protein [Bacillota bacterium]